jgi:hypothetical protein
MIGDRVALLREFYELLPHAAGAASPTMFADVNRSSLPSHGVYFFFERGEYRSDSGDGMRVVRVGTHALTATSKALLAGRLAQHRGTLTSGGGNHRGSIFRLLIGEALLAREGEAVSTWGVGSNAARRVRLTEHNLEKRVSEYLSQMYVFVVSVPDREERAALETRAIALLSNYQREAADAPSETWLGRFSRREKVRLSGLWNNRDVDATYSQVAIAILRARAAASAGARR